MCNRHIYVTENQHFFCRWKRTLYRPISFTAPPVGDKWVKDTRLRRQTPLFIKAIVDFHVGILMKRKKFPAALLEQK